MAINSINPNNPVSNTISSALTATDAETKNIQDQITSKNQSLNRLSSDSKMSAEEKAKERQEIQKQIAELNRKLRMLRMEKKEEAKQAEKKQKQKADLAEDQAKELTKEDSSKILSSEAPTEETVEEQIEKINIPPQSVQKILESGTLLQKERIQENVSQDREATKNILEAEIKSDKLYGSDTTAKREKLSSLIREKPIELKTTEQQEQQKISQKKAAVKIVIRNDRI